MRQFLFVLVALFSAQAAQANLATVAFNNDYRIGDEWGKQPVTLASLVNATPQYRRQALATARVGGATGFYLGQFNGAYVMATNHHVYEAAWNCLGNEVRFPLLNIRATCTKFYGTWTDIDLALFAIEPRSADDARRLNEVAQNFDFSSRLAVGQQLFTLGFGVANNASRQLVGNQDSDCRVFAPDYRFMADPDEFNPGPYRAWSFANGCDVSHGDSGSAMVDAQTGNIVGIIWTGRIPKSPQVQSSDFLAGLLRSGGAEVWTELSYGVPAEKIAEHLLSVAEQAGTPADTRDTLLRLIGR